MPRLRRLEFLRLKYRHKVRLRNKANILRLSTATDLFQFTHRWTGMSPEIPFDPLVHGFGDFEKMRNRINVSPERLLRGLFLPWPDIQKEYQGIIIAPYIFSCRIDFYTHWYYGWDCASGCIWDIEAISSFKLLKPN